MLWMTGCYYVSKQAIVFINRSTNSMSSARRPCTTYKEKTMLNLLHVYTSLNHGSSVLRYWPVTHVTHSHLSTYFTHNPWPADPRPGSRSVYHFRLGWEFFRLAQPARAENYGSTAIMHPKLMHAPTGPITGRSCRSDVWALVLPFASWVNNLLCVYCTRSMPDDAGGQHIMLLLILVMI